jgi:hypothetical protein
MERIRMLWADAVVAQDGIDLAGVTGGRERP